MFAMLRRKRQPAFHPKIRRDAYVRPSVVRERCPVYLATQQTESVMTRAAYLVTAATRYENDATKEVSIYYMLGVALGYCEHHGVTEREDVGSVVRDTMRCWDVTAEAADHLADTLEVYLADKGFAAKIIGIAGEAVLANPGEDIASVDRIIGRFALTVKEWRTFDVHAHLN